MDKAALRQKIRQQKRGMTDEDIVRRSEKLRELFVSTAAYRNAKTIYGYLSFNQEVRTAPMLAQALRDGKQVALPKVCGDTLKFILMEDLSRVERGYAGISEPVADTPVADDKTALVLVPGLAFTQNGDRLGYGGGFYDRFLTKEPNHPTLALCYDFQIVDSLPTEAHDVPVDTVLWV